MTNAIATESMTASGGGWSGHTFRFVVKSPKVVAGGDECRVTLKAGTNGFVLGDLFIGKQTSGNGMSNQVRVKFGGNNSVSCAGGQDVTSDWIAFPFSSNQPLMFSAYFSGTSDVARTRNPESENYDLYYKSGVNDASASSPSGHTQGTKDRSFVLSMESREIADEPASESSGVSVPLWKPPSFDCLAGTTPTLPSYTPYDKWTDAKHIQTTRLDPVCAEHGGHVLVFGCSAPEGCVVAPYWSPWAINYGIGGELIAHFLNRLPQYASIHNAAAVVLYMGVNDIGVASPDMAAIKAQMMLGINWLTGPCVWVNVTPTKTLAWRDNINDFNAYIVVQVANLPNWRVVDVNTELSDANGLLKDDYANDNEHLNAAGQRILSAAVRQAIGLG